MNDCDPRRSGVMVIDEIATSMRLRTRRRKQRLEVVAFDIDGHAGALGRLGDDVDLEAFEVAALGLELEGRVVRIGADVEHVLREGGDRAGGDADGGGEDEQIATGKIHVRSLWC